MGQKGEKIKIEYDREYGSGTFTAPFEGVITSMERRYRETQSEGMKRYYEEFMSNNPCPECNGARLKKESLAVTVGGLNIYELTCRPVSEIREFFDNLTLTEKGAPHRAPDTRRRSGQGSGSLWTWGWITFTLARSSYTLSGGEAQRIRLATQIGSGLMGVMYILDEPSIGLHQR